jgi:hypothetical protein
MERIFPYQIRWQKDDPIQHWAEEREAIVFVTASQPLFPRQLGRKLMAMMCLGVEWIGQITIAHQITQTRISTNFAIIGNRKDGNLDCLNFGGIPEMLIN